MMKRRCITTSLPDTTPDQPYLTDFGVRDGTSWSRRTVLATTMDYKLSRNDRLSLSFQYGLYFDEVNNRLLSFFVNRVAPRQFHAHLDPRLRRRG